jgi:hypothetical protein
MNRVKVGMVADVMLLEGADDIPPSTLFQDTRFFADELERGANVAGGEHFSEALAGIIVRRQEVILGIEPKDKVYLGMRVPGTGSGTKCEQANGYD